jgi:protein-tyrosine-phosphatase
MILFICAANVGRSQIAAGFLRHIKPNLDITSAAAYEDVGAKYGYKPHPLVSQAMLKKGIDISAQEVKMINPLLVAKAIKIFVLCDYEKCPKYLQVSEKAFFLHIEDPYQKGDNSNLTERISKSIMEIEMLIKDKIIRLI